MNNEPIYTFVNNRDGITSLVFKTSAGFHVCLKDDDSGNVLPTSVSFPFAIREAEQQAVKQALKWIGQ